MTTSIIFARFIGPVMMIAAAAMLRDREAIRDVAEDFMTSPALIYVAGILTLATGLAIVTFHNFWVLDWRVIITAFGYLCIITGIFRMIFPTHVKELGLWMLGTHPIVRFAAAFNALIGAFLTYKGFFS